MSNHHNQPISEQPPSTSPNATAYFNAIGLPETTHTVWTRLSLQEFCHFLLPKFLTVFTLKTCFWSHHRTQCVSSATAWVKGTHCMGTDPLICWTRLYLRKVQYIQTFNKCSIYSWAAALGHAKVQLDPALACPFQRWCGTGHNLQTLPAVTTKRKILVEPFPVHKQAPHQALQFFPLTPHLK